ncbi:hypothetical protein DPMN_052685 [Dreissena polymorpha]|uniref:Uncharacterized protein n=1 Tax=Dreissena polymorpha TaxID=45954 RepID=A0A9D4CM83_DREPO|nr:hypothetical protein DPMN_052685 [Dreissena polymorpha]
MLDMFIAKGLQKPQLVEFDTEETSLEEIPKLPGTEPSICMVMCRWFALQVRLRLTHY